MNKNKSMNRVLTLRESYYEDATDFGIGSERESNKKLPIEVYEYDEEEGKNRIGLNRKIGSSSVGVITYGGQASASPALGYGVKESSEGNATDLNKQSFIDSNMTREDIRAFGEDKLGLIFDEDISFEEFYDGMIEELEHSELVNKDLDVTHHNLVKTAKIVLAHLREDDLYYSKIKKALREKIDYSCLLFEEEVMKEGRKFLDIRKVDDFYEVDKLDEYLQDNGKEIGKGSSRIVYLVDSSKVLKFAYNEKGIAQNKVEKKISVNPAYKDLVAPVLRTGLHDVWMLSEIVRPIKGSNEFEKLSGISFNAFVDLLYKMDADGMFYSSVEELINNNKEAKGTYLKYRPTPQGLQLINRVWGLVKDNKIGPTGFEDILRMDHWGKTASGKIVLLDYGLDDDVEMKYYNNDSFLEEESNVDFDVSPEHIDINQIKQLHGDELYDYLETFGKPLGQGSSRAVYVVDNDKVLKYAKNDEGIEQNMYELKVYTNPNNRDLVTRIYDYDREYYEWILSERVEQLTSYSAFEDAIGMDPYVFDHILLKMEEMGLNHAREYLDYLEENPENPMSYIRFHTFNEPLIDRMIMFLRDSELHSSDVASNRQWGKTKNGNFVILDSGASKEYIQKHYGHLLEEDVVEASKFIDMNIVRKLKNDNELQNYLYNNRDKVLGQGSSRIVFPINDQKVLKYAYNEKGISQNEAELKIASNPDNKDVIAAIYTHGPSNRWLVSQKVNAVKSSKEFQQLTGISFVMFSKLLESLFELGEYDTVEGMMFEKPSIYRFIKTYEQSAKMKMNFDFVNLVWDAAQTNNLILADLKKLDHWGTTKKNKVVLMDYGYDEEVWEKHYSSKEKRKQDSGNVNIFKDEPTQVYVNPKSVTK